MRTYISAPRSDEEIEALEKRVEELEAKLREAEERAALGEKPPGPTNRPTDTELATMSWFDLRREAERARAAELKLTVGLDQAIVSFRGTPTAVSPVDATDGTHLEPRCSGCGGTIDPTTCWCGSPVDGHGYGDGHSAVPMGCICHRR